MIKMITQRKKNSVYRPKPKSRYYKKGPHSENEVCKGVQIWLGLEGWRVTNRAQRRYLHTDISATKNGNIRRIEVKGKSTEPSGDFLQALGQIIKIVSNKNTEYYIALPKLKAYQNQARSISMFVRKALNLGFLFVDEKGTVKRYTANKKIDIF